MALATRLFGAGGFRWKAQACAATLSEDGETLWSLHTDGAFLEWSLRTRKPVKKHALTLPTSTVLEAELTRSLKAVVQSFRRCEVWDLASDSPKLLLESALEGRSLVLSTDETAAMSTGYVLDLTTLEVQRVSRKDYDVLALTADRHFLLRKCSRKTTLSLGWWNEQDALDAMEFPREVSHAQCSNDGEHCYLACGREVLCLRLVRKGGKLAFGAERWRSAVPEALGTLVLLAKDTELLCWSDQTYWVFDALDGTLLRSFPGLWGEVATTNDGSVAVLGDAQPFFLASFRKGIVEDLANTEQGAPFGLACSPSGKWLAWMALEAVVVCDASTGAVRSTIEPGALPMRLAFAPSERELLIDGVVYDASTGEALTTFVSPRGEPRAALEGFRVSNDGALVLWWGSVSALEHVVALVELSSGQERWRRLTQGSLFAGFGAASSDELVLVTEGRLVHRLDPRTGEDLQPPVGLSDEVGLLRGMERGFLWAHRTWYTASIQQQVQVAQLTFPELRDVWQLALSARKTFLDALFVYGAHTLALYFGHERSLQVFTRTGDPLVLTLPDPEDEVYSATFSPDETVLYVSTGLGGIYAFALGA